MSGLNDSISDLDISLNETEAVVNKYLNNLSVHQELQKPKELKKSETEIDYKSLKFINNNSDQIEEFNYSYGDGHLDTNSSKKNVSDFFKFVNAEIYYRYFKCLV